MQEKTFNCRAQGCKSVIWVQESTFIVFLNCFGRFLTTFFEVLSAEATASKIALTCRKTLLVAVFFSVTQFSNDSWGFQKSIQNIVRVSLCVYMIWKCSLSAFRTIINRICLFKYRCSGLFMACCRLSIWISWKLRIKKEKIQEMCQTEEKTVSLNGQETKDAPEMYHSVIFGVFFVNSSYI